MAGYGHLTAMIAPRPLLLTYNAQEDCCFDADHALQPLLDVARPYRARVWGALALTIVVTGLSTLPPIFLRYLAGTRFLAATALGFGTSLFFELTQLGGAHLACADEAGTFAAVVVSVVLEYAKPDQEPNIVL